MNKYKSRRKALIILEDGTIFYGKSVGFEGLSFGGLYSNKGMPRYTEMCPEPLYNGQLLVLTIALIRNYDTDKHDIQSNSG